MWRQRCSNCPPIEAQLWARTNWMGCWRRHWTVHTLLGLCWERSKKPCLLYIPRGRILLHTQLRIDWEDRLFCCDRSLFKTKQIKSNQIFKGWPADFTVPMSSNHIVKNTIAVQGSVPTIPWRTIIWNVFTLVMLLTASHDSTQIRDFFFFALTFPNNGADVDVLLN